MKVMLKAPVSYGFPAHKRPARRPDLILIDTLPSTNTWCVRNIDSLHNGDIVTALNQTGGRGRFNRKWLFVAGGSIAMSAVIDGASFSSTACLGQAAAIAVARLLKKLGLKPELKWPNDVIINKRKVSGILLETAGCGFIILGIGINVNIPRKTLHKSGLADIATSINAETSRKTDGTKLLPIFLRMLGRELSAYQKKGVGYITRTWKQMDYLRNSIITVAQPGGTVSGEYAGLSKDGFLLIKTAAGTDEITSGDISIRQIKQKG